MAWSSSTRSASGSSDRDDDGEGGAASRGFTDADRTLVRFGDCPADCESDTAGPGHLARPERLEDGVCLLR